MEKVKLLFYGGGGVVCLRSGEVCMENAHAVQPCTTDPIEGTFSVSSPSQHTVVISHNPV